MLIGATMKALTISIPTPLRQYAGGKADVEVGGNTVAAALSALTGQYPDLKKHLFSDDGKLRAFVAVYVNDEDIRYLEKENTPVQPGDSISIIPSIAGGGSFLSVIPSEARDLLSFDEKQIPRRCRRGMTKKEGRRI